MSVHPSLKRTSIVHRALHPSLASDIESNIPPSLELGWKSLAHSTLIELGQEPLVRPTISCIESLPPTTSVSELRTPTYIAVQHKRISNAHRAASWASISVVDSNPTTCVYIRPSGVILILTLDLRTYHSPTDLQIFAHAFHTRSLHRWQLRNELWRLWVIECRLKLALELFWTRTRRSLEEARLSLV